MFCANLPEPASVNLSLMLSFLKVPWIGGSSARDTHFGGSSLLVVVDLGRVQTEGNATVSQTEKYTLVTPPNSQVGVDRRPRLYFPGATAGDSIMGVSYLPVSAPSATKVLRSKVSLIHGLFQCGTATGNSMGEVRRDCLFIACGGGRRLAVGSRIVCVCSCVSIVWARISDFRMFVKHNVVRSGSHISQCDELSYRSSGGRPVGHSLQACFASASQLRAHPAHVLS